MHLYTESVVTSYVTNLEIFDRVNVIHFSSYGSQDTFCFCCKDSAISCKLWRRDWRMLKEYDLPCTLIATPMNVFIVYTLCMSACMPMYGTPSLWSSISWPIRWACVCVRVYMQEREKGKGEDKEEEMEEDERGREGGRVREEEAWAQSGGNRVAHTPHQTTLYSNFY